jgi:hypothetical protein
VMHLSLGIAAAARDLRPLWTKILGAVQTRSSLSRSFIPIVVLFSCPMSCYPRVGASVSKIPQATIAIKGVEFSIPSSMGSSLELPG